MLLHQLGDDLVLLDELGLKPLDELRLKLLCAGWPACRALQSTLSLIEHVLDPGVDLAGLKAELVGQVGNRFFATDMATDDLSLLRQEKCRRNYLVELTSDRLDYNPTGTTFRFSGESWTIVTPAGAISPNP